MITGFERHCLVCSHFWVVVKLENDTGDDDIETLMTIV